MSNQRKPAKSIAEDGTHPLYTVWFVQNRLHSLDVAMDSRRFDKCEVQHQIATLAPMRDEWLTENGITRRYPP